MTGADGRRPIVVGVDPDPSRRLVLAWAADEADRRALPLRLVHAQGVPTRGYRSGEVRPSWEEWNRALHGLGDQVLKEAVAFVESRRPAVEVSTLLAEGEPAWVLREEARSAALVVVGSWHLSRRREMFTSASVALPLTAHAPCPVVVVPEPEHVTQQPAYVVVGVDGSPHSAAAVDVAFEEAALRGALLRALYVWHPPLLGVLDEDAAVRECRRVLSETVAGRTARYPGVELHHEVVLGHPVRVLTEASEHALGLVVGTRGHGGFTGMLLGSVSQGVLHHAHCPVITVPV
ncbi:universal stress protein [Streptomyces ipomoeae]|jgi:nucleotide-binding universal stress UspA family protein|uniref:Universal stress family protein n=2 Tax=Streptomyces ipomoeae TaxID=103232 RepID=L1L5X3_9ACTN|nr:universal stress protein [Streptomyces ipomoeae]EKX68461.1 universal stress family protein [Streptomyces ipomoeae 91-03]MDX2692099.1 universal stress protein [Streptomyces ipomoeae]MDX2820426.1 universal stress protein [Streptomyces ipomoeae]MDX2837474.1 universal stress protein [Streptomyces ipomoeae]MDX2874032.1 universal stress protein [Streptomyces ipomoeae]